MKRLCRSLLTVGSSLCLIAAAWAAEDSESKIPELAALKRQFDKPLAAVGTETEERLKRLQLEYLSVLGDLKRTWTAQGKLDDLLAVKTEMERVFAGKETT